MLDAVSLAQVRLRGTEGPHCELSIGDSFQLFVLVKALDEQLVVEVHQLVKEMTPFLSPLISTQIAEGFVALA